MPIETAFSSTQIMARLRTTDQTHPVIEDLHLREAAPTVDAQTRRLIRDHVDQAVTITLRDVPERPNPHDAARGLSALARQIDCGGKLHAALRHAFGIARPASAETPLPGLPGRLPGAAPELTRREAAIVVDAHDAVSRAIDDFRNGVAQTPYHLHGDPRDDARFLGDVRARQDVYDILDRASINVEASRARAHDHADTLHDDGSVFLNAEQHALLRETARGFVTDLVRDGQAAVRGATSPAERKTALHRHVDAATAELGIDREPLRFATTHVSDEYYPRAHAAVAATPSFTHADIRALDEFGPLVDLALIDALRTHAYPVESTAAALREAQAASSSMRISRHPLGRAAAAAAAIALHLNPQLHPLRAARPFIASRKCLAVSLLGLLKLNGLDRAMTYAAAHCLTASRAQTSAASARAVYDRLRAPETQATD